MGAKRKQSQKEKAARRRTKGEERRRDETRRTVDDRVVRVVDDKFSFGFSDPGSDGSRVSETSEGMEEEKTGSVKGEREGGGDGRR